MYKNGFDLTTFHSMEAFGAVLSLLGSGPWYSKHDTKQGWFEFTGPNGFLITACDPVSGKYGRPGQREDEPLYASYMRLETHSVLVGNTIADFINTHADVKEFTRGTVRFI